MRMESMNVGKLYLPASLRLLPHVLENNCPACRRDSRTSHNHHRHRARTASASWVRLPWTPVNRGTAHRNSFTACREVQLRVPLSIRFGFQARSRFAASDERGQLALWRHHPRGREQVASAALLKSRGAVCTPQPGQQIPTTPIVRSPRTAHLVCIFDLYRTLTSVHHICFIV
jgi:hypothetical protein